MCVDELLLTGDESRAECVKTWGTTATILEEVDSKLLLCMEIKRIFRYRVLSML